MSSIGSNILYNIFNTFDYASGLSHRNTPTHPYTRSIHNALETTKFFTVPMGVFANPLSNDNNHYVCFTIGKSPDMRYTIRYRTHVSSLFNGISEAGHIFNNMLFYIL